MCCATKRATRSTPCRKPRRRKRRVRLPKRETRPSRRPSLRQHALLQAAGAGGVRDSARTWPKARRVEKACVGALAKSAAHQGRLDAANPGMVPRLVGARLVLPAVDVASGKAFERGDCAAGLILVAPRNLALFGKRSAHGIRSSAGGMRFCPGRGQKKFASVQKFFCQANEPFIDCPLATLGETFHQLFFISEADYVLFFQLPR